tara:strand:- start:250 stop:738 length:489 start_codon:yes stop_codon:yes gene_type:complete
MRWSPQADIQRMFVGNGCPPVVPPVRGCQQADHNTSTKQWNHKDAYEIINLSALLPFMNKEFPFHLRNGFDQGLLRRCARRHLHVPSVLGAVVTYIDNDGQKQEYTVDYHKEGQQLRFIDADNEQVYMPTRDNPLPPGIQQRPEGMEQSAVTAEGKRILDWW